MPASDMNELNGPYMAANGPATSEADRYAPAAWKSPYEDLTVPSGGTCLVRRIAMEDLISSGLVDDLDFLSTMVERKHIGPKAKVVNKEAARSGNPAKRSRATKKTTELDETRQGIAALRELGKDNLVRLVHMMDQVAMACVVKPKLHPVPAENPDERDPDKIYIDFVDLPD